MPDVMKTCVLFALALALAFAYGCAAPVHSGGRGGEQTDILRRFHSSSQDRVARQYMPVKKPAQADQGAP